MLWVSREIFSLLFYLLTQLKRNEKKRIYRIASRYYLIPPPGAKFVLYVSFSCVRQNGYLRNLSYTWIKGAKYVYFFARFKSRRNFPTVAFSSVSNLTVDVHTGGSVLWLAAVTKRKTSREEARIQVHTMMEPSANPLLPGSWATRIRTIHLSQEEQRRYR